MNRIENESLKRIYMMNILLVDDETAAHFSLIMALQPLSSKYNVKYEAYSGSQALDILSRHNDIAIALVDINMPEMNGIELSFEIKSRYPSVAIIILSVYDDYQCVRDAFLNGACDYIRKCDLKSEEIQIVLDRTVQRMNSSENKNIIDNGQSSDIAKEEYLHDLINNPNKDTTKRQIISELRFDINHFLVCALFLDPEQMRKRYQGNFTQLYKSIIQLVSHILERYGCAEMILSEDDMMFVFYTPRDYLNYQQEVNRLLKEIQFILNEYVNIQPTIGVSHILDNKTDTIANLLLEAQQRALCHVGDTEGEIVYEDAPFNYFVNKMKEFVQIHYAENISLKDLSNTLYLSESRLSYLFNQYNNVSFSQYLNIFRINMAKKLMKTERFKIYEVATKVGYKNVEHFSRVFKKIVGLSPKEYYDAINN